MFRQASKQLWSKAGGTSSSRSILAGGIVGGAAALLTAASNNTTASDPTLAISSSTEVEEHHAKNRTSSPPRPFATSSNTTSTTNNNLKQQIDHAQHQFKVTYGKPVRTNEEVPPDQDLRIISLEELRQHTDAENGGLWVSYKGHVYDVTNFPQIHPGGPGRIEMAAGTDLEKYFEVYHLHPNVKGYLDRTSLIGRLTPQDALAAKEETQFDNPFANDPVTDLRDPFGRAPKWSNLMSPDILEDFYTPNKHFYVRNHFPIPQWDNVEQDYSFDLILPTTTNETGEEDGDVTVDRTYSLQDLRESGIPEHTVSSVMVCGGPALYPRYLHRTNDRQGWKDQPVFERNGANHNFWGGHGKWTGYKLRDLLKANGMDVDAMALGTKPLPAKYLKLTGHDVDETGAPFGITIPLEKVIDPFGDVLLATQLNDEPLTPDHGYPLRVLVPGFAGVRNCKWLAKIELSNELHECHVDTHTDEVIYPPDVNFEDHASAPTGSVSNNKLQQYWKTHKIWRVMEMPTMSFVASPSPNDTFTVDQIIQQSQSSKAEEEAFQGGITVRGYAFDGSGQRIVRVDVSFDGGKTYSPAELDDHGMEQIHHRNHHWSWYSWSKTVRLEDLDDATQHKLVSLQKQQQQDLGSSVGGVEIKIAARAVAANGNTQPSRDDAPSLYNFVGNVNNAQTHTPITILPPSSQ